VRHPGARRLGAGHPILATRWQQAGVLRPNVDETVHGDGRVQRVFEWDTKRFVTLGGAGTPPRGCHLWWRSRLVGRWKV
jgi:hypothetical protein